MPLISVIIPYYQTKQGVLRRAVQSVVSQRIPEDWNVDIIVVDDGSPSPASIEVEELCFSPQMNLVIYPQANAGVASARNAALDNVKKEAALIAYLDSDDYWSEDHLERGVHAYQSGYDFYCCDNSRLSHHKSKFELSELIQEFIKSTSVVSSGVIGLPDDLLEKAVIKEFPVHLSAVIHTASIGKDVRFSTLLKFATEDVLYVTSLALRSKKPCLDLGASISCGCGVNIYFGSQEWDHPRHMSIRRDQVFGYTLIERRPEMSQTLRKVAKLELKRHRSDFVFHIVRRIYRKREGIPKELIEMIRFDPRTVFWIPVSLYRVLRYYEN